MVNESFCTPCQRMLAQEDVHREENQYHSKQYPHHQHGDSFRQALRLRCAICVQIWTEFGSPDHLHRTTWCLLFVSNVLFSISLTHWPSKPSPVELATLKLEPPPDNDIQEVQDIQLSNNTGSDQSFEFLKFKFKQCKESHSKCLKNTTQHYLPVRLLDVGSEPHDTVHLVEARCLPEPAPYISLSHCWGASVPYKLTASTAPTLRSGLPVVFLSKTFQDAIAATRKLEIRYLWIDSLCIFQDDLEDWSTQAAVMQDVYQHATLNIAATAAHDGDVGLFYRRDPMAWIPIRIDAAWRFIPLDKTSNAGTPRYRSYILNRIAYVNKVIDNAPLNRRAWVMQERHLSRRIAHYTNEMIFWECHETLANEVYPDGFSTGPRDSPFDPTRLKRLMNPRHQTNERADRHRMLHQAWASFRDAYTNCHLTCPEDKLIALSGVAQSLSVWLQDELVAGLWRAQFIQQLCWRVLFSKDPRPRPTIWRAPSWSWASTDNHTRESGFASSYGGELSTRREMVQTIHLDTHVKASGALISCFVKLKCKLVNALVCSEKDEWSWGRFVFFSDNGKTVSAAVDLDGPEFMTLATDRSSIEFLILDSYIGQYGTTGVAGIALVPSTCQRDAYERIGYFEGDYQIASPHGSFYGELVARHEKAEEQIITLV